MRNMLLHNDNFNVSFECVSSF